MKILYIHIGTHKTATTAIQGFLAANQELLSRKGCAFPIFPFNYPGKRSDRNGLFLTWPCEDAEGNRYPEEEKRRFTYAMDVIHAAFRTHDMVVLTDEAIWRNLFYHGRETLDRLLADAADNGYIIRMIVYLRRQDQFLESMWNQMIKMRNNFTTDFDIYLHQYKHKYLYYDSMLFYFADRIGDENLIVKRFADAVKGDGIVADFMGILGLDLTAEYIFENEDSNIGLYGNTVRIKQLINQMDDLTLREANMFRNSLVNISSIAKQEYPCSEFTEEGRRAFMDRFRDGNAAIADRFIGDGRPLFSEDYAGKPKRTVDAEHLIDDVIRSSAAADLTLYRRYDALKSSHDELFRRHRELLSRVKFLERQAIRQEKRIEHLRHPLRRLIRRVLSWFGIHREEAPVSRWTPAQSEETEAALILPGLNIEPYPAFEPLEEIPVEETPT